MNEEQVIIVDENDIQTGSAGKMEAHRNAILHRAVSVFIVDSMGTWLLQKRALDKYHSKGLWTNTCCTHPLPGETVFQAAKRRLSEEMGITCELKEVFSFIYKEKMDNDLTEHEFDHVFTGISDDDPVINTLEVVDWKRISFYELKNDILLSPETYTWWFRKIFEKVNGHLKRPEE